MWIFFPFFFFFFVIFLKDSNDKQNSYIVSIVLIEVQWLFSVCSLKRRGKLTFCSIFNFDAFVENFSQPISLKYFFFKVVNRIYRSVKMNYSIFCSLVKKATIPNSQKTHQGIYVKTLHYVDVISIQVNCQIVCNIIIYYNC